MRLNMAANEIVTEVHEGVYKLLDFSLAGQRTLIHKGMQIHSFMDFLYTENPNLDELTEDQVSALCRERANNPERINNNSHANTEVKNLLAHLVNIHRPINLLEIGSGTTPVLSDSSKTSRYILADSDQNVVDQNRTNNKECIKFASNDKLLFSNQNFNMIIASFVFHFKIYDSQLEELARCLHSEGAIITNVYRRTEQSRLNLIESLKTFNLRALRISDEQSLCRDHEYWIIGHIHNQHLEKYQDGINGFMKNNKSY